MRHSAGNGASARKIPQQQRHHRVQEATVATAAARPRVRGRGGQGTEPEKPQSNSWRGLNVRNPPREFDQSFLCATMGSIHGGGWAPADAAIPYFRRTAAILATSPIPTR